jgi:hypothetical protein
MQSSKCLISGEHNSMGETFTMATLMDEIFQVRRFVACTSLGQI